MRFKDGLPERVQLHQEDLTGVLARCAMRRSSSGSSSITVGGVWPGEIDLAPDAMYQEAAGGFVADAGVECRHTQRIHRDH